MPDTLGEDRLLEEAEQVSRRFRGAVDEYVKMWKRVQAARAQALVGGGVPEGRADP